MTDNSIDFKTALERTGVNVCFEPTRGWMFTVDGIVIQTDYRTAQAALEGMLIFLVDAYRDSVNQEIARYNRSLGQAS
jgi:hypothetical protein